VGGKGWAEGWTSAGDGLEHEHHPISPDHGPEVVVAVSVAAAFVEDAEAQFVLVEGRVAARSSTMKKGVMLFNMPGGTPS